MKSIDVEKPTVHGLFAGRQYNIDYYQREYKWGRKQVAQLLTDLFSSFKESWNAGDEKEAILEYDGYFLGPVILTTRGFLTDIVDGQQRLTTLTLLILALRRHDDVIEEGQRSDLIDLVATKRIEGSDFKLAVREREACMEALLNGDESSFHTDEPSVQNMLDRFGDIEEIVSSDLETEAIPRFADWLMHRVQMVSVMASTDADAYTIFETMNDRGLSLTMTEMLRGYLLSRIEGPQDRNRAVTDWKRQISMLNDLDRDEDKEDVDALQAWLRGRHAITASQYRKNVDYGDYERIGNEFHRWVRDVEESHLGLKESSDFVDFVGREFTFYTTQYARLWRAGKGNDGDLESVEYVASQGFTLHYMLLLAAITPMDDNDEVLLKLRAAAAYVDILIHRRLWKGMRISQTSLRYPLFDLAKDLRRCVSVEDVAERLTTALADEKQAFSPDWRFRRNQRNSNIVRRILARLTLFVENGSAKRLKYRELSETGRRGFDIEHVLANVHSRYRDQWPERSVFEDERSWIGGLLLIPSRENRAMGKMTYEKKLPIYLRQNRLAASLNESAYDRDPAFHSFRKQSGLPLKAYQSFGKQELEERQELYEQVAAQVWSPDRIRQEAGL